MGGIREEELYIALSTVLTPSSSLKLPLPQQQSLLENSLERWSSKQHQLRRTYWKALAEVWEVQPTKLLISWGDTLIKPTRVPRQSPQPFSRRSTKHGDSMEPGPVLESSQVPTRHWGERSLLLWAPTLRKVLAYGWSMSLSTAALNKNWDN